MASQTPSDAKTCSFSFFLGFLVDSQNGSTAPPHWRAGPYGCLRTQLEAWGRLRIQKGLRYLAGKTGDGPRRREGFSYDFRLINIRWFPCLKIEKCLGFTTFLFHVFWQIWNAYPSVRRCFFWKIYLPILIFTKYNIKLKNLFFI